MRIIGKFEKWPQPTGGTFCKTVDFSQSWLRNYPQDTPPPPPQSPPHRSHVRLDVTILQYLGQLIVMPIILFVLGGGCQDRDPAISRPLSSLKHVNLYLIGNPDWSWGKTLNIILIQELYFVRRVFNTFDCISVILRCDFHIFDFRSVILRRIFNIFHFINVIFWRVSNTFDFISVILRCVFHIFYFRSVMIS